METQAALVRLTPCSGTRGGDFRANSQLLSPSLSPLQDPALPDGHCFCFCWVLCLHGSWPSTTSVEVSSAKTTPTKRLNPTLFKSPSLPYGDTIGGTTLRWLGHMSGAVFSRISPSVCSHKTLCPQRSQRWCVGAGLGHT